MQKINCILKILFNNDELTPRVENIKALHTIEAKGALEFAVRIEYPHCVHT